MSKTLLIVDDDDAQRAIVRKIVEQERDWRVFEARDGQEALDMLCDGLRPQLCLIDLTMPKIGGMELLQRIRRDPALRSLKAMVASASSEREIVIELAKLRIEGYLIKPYHTEKALAALRAVLAAIPDPESDGPTHRNVFAKTVLVVDDDPVARTALRKIIQRDLLWEIVETEGAQEALDKLQSGLKPDICLIDLNMPQIDGTTLISTLRSDPALSQLRIAVVSGVQDREKIRTLAKMRIDAYVLKPLNAAKVEAVLRAAAPA